MITAWRCVCCGETVDPPGLVSRATCPGCGPEDGVLEPQFDLERVSAVWRRHPLRDRPLDHWRYAELLPLAPASIPRDWRVGWTPVVDAARLARHLGIGRLLLKDEGRNPSASFKDRASSVGVAHASQLGAKTIACASTGNAATSLACHAALAGLEAVIFVPDAAPEPKLAQLLVYGATVFAVRGTYDQAYRLCTAACDEFDWYNRNCAINPVLVEGKKTAGLEIAEQSQSWERPPDWIAVSVGDGCTIAGIWKGLIEMHELGAIDRLPRLLAVQSESVAPIAFALREGRLPAVDEGTTLADSINVQVPRNWRKAVRALHEADGVVVCVSDEEILEAMRASGAAGVFAEPAAAAAVAGVAKAAGRRTLGASDHVLAMITGSGLKDTKNAIRAGGAPLRIKPTLDSVAAELRADGGVA